MAQEITADNLARELGADPSSLRGEISKSHRLDIAVFIDWKAVGPRLDGITTGDIKDIDKEGCDELDKRRKLVDQWWQKNGHRATYHAMITAMLKVGRSADAEKVCKLLSIVTSAVTDGPSQATAIPDHTIHGGIVPTLPLLMEVELPFQVKERVNEFGTFLLQDDKGEKMAAIHNKCGEDKQKMVIEILREWLAGNGAEVSWRSLISVLTDSQLPILARQVQTLDPENSGTQLVDPDSGIFCITDEKPTLRQLLRLNLPFRVGEDVYYFGSRLLGNHDFMVNRMEDSENFTFLILRDWLAGEGRDVTWEVLIEALRGPKLIEICREVEIALRRFQNSK